MIGLNGQRRMFRVRLECGAIATVTLAADRVADFERCEMKRDGDDGVLIRFKMKCRDHGEAKNAPRAEGATT